MACYKIYKKNNVPLCKNTHTYINGTNKAVLLCKRHWGMV